MMHAPTSTPNTITFVETGILSIQSMIHIKQLSFLHHILQLTPDNVVNQVYQQQLKYPSEPNWANTVKSIRKKYNIEEEDETIKEMTKCEWKGIIKKKIQNYAFQELITSTQQLSHIYIDLPTEFNQQKYITELPLKMLEKYSK